jgi:viologen exporter family transport system permease protein
MMGSLGLYRRLISIKIRSQMQYRGSFLFDLFATAMVSAVSFISIALVLQTFKGIGGWSLWEVAFLYGSVEFSFGIMDMLFGGFDPPYFGNHVRLGDFDQMLLKPANIYIQVFGSEFMLRRIGRILQAAIIFGLALANLEITWTPFKIAYLPIMLASLVAFFGGVFIIGSAITFWTVDSIEVVNIFTYGGTEMMSYPMHIFPDWLRTFFTFIIPAIFLNYYPALYFLDKPDPLGMPPFAPFLAPFVGVGFLAVGMAFWRYGLGHYQSTGT